MPVPETYAGKVTKADFEAVAVEVNTKLGKAGGESIVSATDTQALVLKGSASQTTSIFSIQSNGGANYTSVYSGGELETYRGFYTRAWFNNYNALVSVSEDGATAANAYFKNASGSELASIGPKGGIFTQTTAATTKGLVVKGAASQTANLAEFQNSAGTILVRVDKDGALYAPGTFVGTGGDANVKLFVGSELATSRGMLVRGAASQTANLAEFQNSAGTVLAAIDAAGKGIGGLASEWEYISSISSAGLLSTAIANAQFTTLNGLGYKRFRIRTTSARLTDTTNHSFLARFNGLTTAIYSSKLVAASGLSPQVATSSSATAIALTTTADGSSTGVSFRNILDLEVDAVPVGDIISCKWVFYTSQGSSAGSPIYGHGHAELAADISSIGIYTNSPNNWVAGSTFDLYGSKLQ